jgi:hypothetical protein
LECRVISNGRAEASIEFLMSAKSAIKHSSDQCFFWQTEVAAMKKKSRWAEWAQPWDFPRRLATSVDP